MRLLYHFQLCPFSRKLRVLLAEKNLPFELIEERFWERRPDFALLNPAMQVPVMVEPEGTTVPDSYAIAEFLEAKYPNRRLLGETPEEGAGIRRLISWFDQKFFLEVTRYLLNEKVLRYYTNVGEPSSEALRAATLNMIPHIQYLDFLLEDHKWLMGDRFSMADIAAAAQLSVVDYLGNIPWEQYPRVKDWYALVKSRPSFRPILADRVAGFVPPKCYANVDF